jgi:DNA repair protein RecN (Recombination protein N)
MPEPLMLATLRIRNFVLIDQLELQLGPGLNVLTGETGAGKSIVVDALGLLLGGRASPDVVRPGAPEAEVEALFELDPGDPSFGQLTTLNALRGNELVLRRVVAQGGRSRAYVNGRLSTAGELAQIGPWLMDIASQHESVALTDPATHLGYLDTFAQLDAERERIGADVDALRDLVRKARQAAETARTRAERESFLRFQLGAIDEVGPQAGEDEALLGERSKLRHSSRLLDVAQRSSEALSEGESTVVDLLGRVVLDLRQAGTIDRELVPLAEALESARVEVAEASRALGRYAEGIEADPDRLQAVEERLFALEKLKRQHGPALEDVLAAASRLRQELETLSGAEAQIGELRQAYRQALARAGERARALSAKRKQAALGLSEAITRELAALGMGSANVVVEVAPLAPSASPEVNELELAFEGARLGRDGIDRVEFLIAPNRGVEPRPLRRVASGGELSRALLALKRVLADGAPAGLYVFDEVDTGVGGAIADCIGRALADVAVHRQVLCITHLAPIAAFADTHFVVEKGLAADVTRSVIGEVRGKQRVQEIARMISGATVTDAARRAAVALLRDARPAAAKNAESPSPPATAAKPLLPGFPPQLPRPERDGATPTLVTSVGWLPRPGQLRGKTVLRDGLEGVFRPPQPGEDLDLVDGGVVARADRGAQGRGVRAQEGVRRAVFAEREGHRGALGRARFGHAAAALGERGVVGVDVGGEAQVRLGVLVAAVDERVVGQGAERAGQRFVHLRRGALEEAAAAGAEERVAREHVGRARAVGDDVGDGAERVPGDVRDADAEAERLERRAVGDELGRPLDALAVALVGDDGQAGDRALEVGDAADVIVVVVRRPDADQPQAFAREGGQHGRRLGGVDHDRLAGGAALNQVSIVVA